MCIRCVCNRPTYCYKEWKTFREVKFGFILSFTKLSLGFAMTVAFSLEGKI